MKKYIGLIFALLFPYVLAIGLGGVAVYEDWMYFMMWHYAILWVFGAVLIFGFLGTVTTAVIAIKNRWDGHALAKVNLIIKLCQIPAYIIIFFLAVTAVIGFFMAAPIMALLFILYDCIAIFLTGVIGATAVWRCYKENSLTKNQMLVLGICQFIFCIDVICAIILYIKTRKKT